VRPLLRDQVAHRVVDGVDSVEALNVRTDRLKIGGGQIAT